MNATDNKLSDLIAQRKTLTTALSNCGGGFPGSRGWVAEAAAMKALGDFDATHPQVIVAINQRHNARVSAEHPYQD